jgi:hypothetical protein
MMKAILILFALLALTQAVWVNQTQARFWRDNKRTYFAIPLAPVAANKPYTLQMTFKFADVFDMYTVNFDAVPAEIGAPNIIKKEKGQVDTVVLQTPAGPKQGWAADGLECGVLNGYVESDTTLSSISAALNFDGISSLELPEHCDARQYASATVSVLPALAGIVVLVFALFCCCIGCRRACRRSCRRNCNANAACNYPAAGAAEVPAEFLIPAEDLQASGAQYFVPIPADPNGQFSVPAGTQYVQLVPVMYPAQQQ